MPSWYSKTDTVQKEIVSALRRAGALVFPLSDIINEAPALEARIEELEDDIEGHEEAERALIKRIEALERADRNHIERKHIDATPDEGYPLRILRAYRADCDARWADTSDGDVGNPLTVALNEMQDQRAVVLDRAIAALRREEER